MCSQVMCQFEFGYGPFCYVYLFCLQPPEQFFSYPAAVTITGDWAANFGLCSALRAFEQGGIFIVPHQLRHGTSVYTVSSERPAPTSHSGVRTLNSRIICFSIIIMSNVFIAILLHLQSYFCCDLLFCYIFGAFKFYRLLRHYAFNISHQCFRNAQLCTFFVNSLTMCI